MPDNNAFSGGVRKYLPKMFCLQQTEKFIAGVENRFIAGLVISLSQPFSYQHGLALRGYHLVFKLQCHCR